ncbi:MAG: glycoside hydrolase family 16 protein [Planctomycetes bacterium]|nr:glycoside hydrolase family 16 protein [Planctomycetota bacterium]
MPTIFRSVALIPAALVLAVAMHAPFALAAEPPTVPAAEIPAGWEPAWSDEFSVDGMPDPAKWDYEVGRLRNNEAQYYTRARRENVRVENGELVIEARKEAFEGAEYTSASLVTLGKMQWTSGRFEVRAQLPKGRGMWPAIWLLGSSCPTAGWPRCGEIDIMEFVGHAPGIIHGTVHTEAYNHIKHNQKGATVTLDDPHGTWHVYALEWRAKDLRWLIDGREYFRYDDDGSGVASWPFAEPEYLILNIAVGGAWGGQKGIDETIFPQRMRIDYVRVFKRISD